MYNPKYVEDWKKYFSKLPDNLKIRAVKTIKRILESPHTRHLEHGVPYFVKEFGQNRICYKIDDKSKIVEFYFVGSHKDYEVWYKSI